MTDWFETHSDHTCQNCFMADMIWPANGHPSYVECPICSAVELTYVPQDYQESLHSNPYTEVFNERTGKWELQTQVTGVFGGYGSGKSRPTLQEVLMRCLENPGGTTVFMAQTLGQLKKTTLKTWFNEICPPFLIENYNKTEGEITLINGHMIFIIPTDNEEKLRSMNVGIVHMEEASGIKRTIYDQVLNRLRDQFVTNKLFLVCSNPDLGWIRDILVMNEPRKNPTHPEHDAYNDAIDVFIWESALNKYLPPDFVQINSKGKPEWWIKRYLMGSFDHAEGMIYPMFMATLIDPFDVFTPDKRHWEHYITFDHGVSNPTSVGFHCIDPVRKKVIRYHHYYVAGKTVPEHAKVLKPLIERIPMGRLRFMKADPSIRNKSDPATGKSVQALYSEYGIYWSLANNDWEAGKLKVNSYIERGALEIFRDQVHLIKEAIGYKYPEQSMDNYNEKLSEKPALHLPDHALDELRYGLMALPDDVDLLQFEAFAPPASYKGITGEEYDFDDEGEDMGGNRDWSSYGF